MEKDDARKLSPAAQHERRRQAIRAHRRGRTKTEIALEVGLSHTAVSKVIARYEAEGVAALAPRVRGRRAGEDRALTATQEALIRKIICDKRPEQLKMDFFLWSRAAVMQLIEIQCGIKLHVRSVGKYLARWGFTPQQPIKRAKAEGAEIHWGDETALVNTDVRGRSYAPKGKTPVALAIGGTRHKLSMIASVTNQGKARWLIVDGNFNHERLIQFFDLLIKDTPRKVFLILDNLGVHHCKPVKAWLAAHDQQIEVFYLPSYSPELNPEERLNADLKHVIRSKVPVRTKAKLHAATKAHMHDLAAKPDRVKSYFQDSRVKYAA